MRTNANQCEMPLDAPLEVVLLVRSEADAVRKCLRLAAKYNGRDQKTIALMCGWKTETCLSEIAKESNKRCMPPSRVQRFAAATGCNLLSQYLERVEAERKAAGKVTERDRADDAADICVAYWARSAA